MAEFLIQDQSGFRHVPIAGQMNIGRGADNDLVLNAMFASRRHARVWRQGERFIVEDLSSSHGTYVNGQQVTRPRFLQPNDVLILGDAQLTFVARWDPSLEETPPKGTPLWDVDRTQPGRSFTPTDPVVARPFPAPRSASRRRTNNGACIVLLLLAIVAVLLLTILGVLGLYVWG